MKKTIFLLPILLLSSNLYSGFVHMDDDEDCYPWTEQVKMDDSKKEKRVAAKIIEKRGKTNEIQKNSLSLLPSLFWPFSTLIHQDEVNSPKKKLKEKLD